MRNYLPRFNRSTRVGLSIRTKSFLNFAVLLVLFWTVASSGVAAQSGPEYASDETKEIVEKMIEAHGGVDSWRNAPSFQFTAIMYLAALPVDDERSYYDNWRNYQVTINPRTNQGYVNIEYEDNARPNIGYDGREVWMVDYSFDPGYQDGAFMMLFFHYGMLALPWMSQEPGVVLSYQDRTGLPLSDVQFHRVRMTFDPQVSSEAGYIDFYVHPETFLISGWNSTSPYPLFPGGKFTDILSGNGPDAIRIVEVHSTVDGVVIPRAYTTIRVSEDGSEALMGAHLVVNPSLSKPIDESLIAKPRGATVIRSTN